MIINVEKWGKVRYLRGGSKNITFEFMQPHMTLADGSPMQGQVSYAEIKEIVKIEIPKNYKTLFHPQEETPQPWEYQLLKTIACYNYQVSEDATCNTDYWRTNIYD